MVTTDECMELGPVALAERIRARVDGRPAFLTFDMDFVDPASARETLEFLRALSQLSVIGADIVETNPLCDGPGQVTALLAATVASEFIALIAFEWSG